MKKRFFILSQQFCPRLFSVNTHQFFYYTLSYNKCCVPGLAVDVTTVDVVFFATAIIIVVTDAVVLITSLFSFVIGAVVASITADVIFLAVVIDVFNDYLAVDVTTAHIVFFATAIVIVVTVAVALITIDKVSPILITVIFVVVSLPLSKLMFAILLLMLPLLIFSSVSFLLMFLWLFLLDVVCLSSDGADSEILSFWLFVSILWR